MCKTAGFVGGLTQQLELFPFHGIKANVMLTTGTVDNCEAVSLFDWYYKVLFEQILKIFEEQYLYSPLGSQAKASTCSVI